MEQVLGAAAFPVGRAVHLELKQRQKFARGRRVHSGLLFRRDPPRLRRMLRFSPAALAVLALGLGGAGCESPTGMAPRETITTTLDANARETMLTLAVGAAVKLELPPPRMPGHAWQVVQNDTRFLRPLGGIVPASGGAARATATFHALRIGRTQLKFLAAPVNGAGTAAPDYYDVRVTIE